MAGFKLQLQELPSIERQPVMALKAHDVLTKRCVPDHYGLSEPSPKYKRLVPGNSPPLIYFDPWGIWISYCTLHGDRCEAQQLNRGSFIPSTDNIQGQEKRGSVTVGSSHL